MSDKSKDDLTAEEEDLVVKLAHIFWMAFEKTANTANMEVDPACYDKAIEKRALINLRNNIKDLSDYPTGPNFINTKNCCVVAAVTAVQMARKEDRNATVISPAIYALAFDDTHHNVPVLPNGGKRLGGEPLKILAKLCP
ncbi:MAG: hypothetical protein R3E50_14670 [Halioglobus sp.]